MPPDVLADVLAEPRLAALDAYAILDTPPEEGFDDIVQLATRLCRTPVALVSLVTADRQWFKARVGFPPCETDLNSSVCAHALAEPDLLVIPDLATDPRTAANPLVTGEPHIRFYAGAPLRTAEGQVIGSLCVIDTEPRPGGLTEEQAADLRALARQVMSQLDLKRALAGRDALLAEQAAIQRSRDTLHRTQAAIAEAGGDLDAILRILVAGAMEAVPEADGGAFELVDGGALEYRAVAGILNAFQGAHVPLEGSLSGACFRSGLPLLIPDVRVDARVDQALAERMAMRSCVTVPVVRGRRSVGVLKFQSSRPNAFEERHLQAARLFAGVASAGLTEAREVAAQRAVQASEIHYRAIFESAVDYAIIVMDLDGQVTNWNAGATRILGWTPDAVRGKGADVIFTSEDRAAGIPAQEMHSALTEGRGVDERWHLRKGGERFWANGEMMALREDGGEAIGFVKILRDRTGERETLRSLEESRERYRLATRATNDAIWDWNLATNHILWNEALGEAYGHAPEGVEPTGDWWLAQIHPDDRARVGASIHAVIDGTGTAWTDEYRFRRADGSYAEVLDRGHVIRDGDGRPCRMIGAMLDLTRMRTAEAALRASEERFRTILETVEAAFAIVEVRFDAEDRPVDYRFLEANPAFERQAGVNLRGKWVTEFAPDLERFWFETYGHVAKTGEPATFESYAKAFERWFDVRAVRVGDPADRQIAILFSDVTARRDAEERLRASEALARDNVERVQLALAAGAIIGTWHWDLPTDRFAVDEGFARAFGLDPTLGRDGIPLAQIVATVHPDDQAGLAAAITAAIARGGAYAHQYRVRRADGRYYWIEANGRVDRGPDGNPSSFPGVLIDVEERRAVEAERDRATMALRALNETLEQRVAERTADLMQAEEKLRQSQKMEAVGQLTGGLAHDFNNLLAGISGALELMGTRIAQGRVKDIDKYMVAAQGASKRAAALTHRLLAFSRRQTLDPRPTNVNALVDGMADLIQRTVGPGIPVETVGAAGLWPALVDPSQLENALLNLCINARDAMPEGGRITVETANRWMDREAARTHDMPEGQYLSLCVTDTGTGMPPEVIARVFEPFFTTKPIGQGTGLGLSMIYGFARQSGGQVRIYSEVGQGTTVCLYLPRHHGDAPVEEGTPDRTPAAFAQDGETVLIVDDEPTVRMLVTDVLGDLGYSVIEAADSVAGLKLLRSDVRIDLLITDVGLPGGMNGRQMADAARALRPELKTLFITGYAENAAIGNGHLEPGMQVLSKPFAVDTLAARVRELLKA
ncbi:PAS domain S-box protein [Methylobacterium planeticum]|uniref:histidine kinase n=1 Tax=Methylobacterium planeticum TaxID=2615211 RepID=A0A6N6MQV2_9HYPH|nr:PAS domain S-box protein [Methylobacterium planeticum]